MIGTSLGLFDFDWGGLRTKESRRMIHILWPVKYLSKYKYCCDQVRTVQTHSSLPASVPDVNFPMFWVV